MSEKRSSSGALSGHSPKKFKGNIRHSLSNNMEAPPLNILQQLAMLWRELNRGRRVTNKMVKTLSLCLRRFSKIKWISASSSPHLLPTRTFGGPCGPKYANRKPLPRK